ncbi:ninja-family protein AFP3-like [Canna indica]|uniref:Ninja-family protein n=1 Tax=Canna indica TaxID=4628 RepID=A0AAQ3L003_9LILI|nr:ninja-family protein AFP3-like [Canna indica]
MEAEAAEGKLEIPPSAIESFPRDLLRRLSGESFSGEQREALGGEPEEVELNLNLGLSLGGCFGVDPEGKKLVRSSSIASFSSFPREIEFPSVPRNLVRTISLPSEADEERRKRKELQSLRRLEAKRKRLSKRNSIKLGAARSDDDTDGGKKTLATPMTINARLDLPIGCQFRGVLNIAIPPGLPAWARSKSRATAAVQGSAASQGPSEFENLPTKDHSASGHEAGSAPSTSEARNVSIESNDGNLERNMMGEMPCVFTRGDGPNGRRIEGFLYRYKKREEVRIVCVCHGSFLTPAEFVKHAGGGDVDNPMKHIVVCPSPATLQ